ncbi:SusC/RagA family TonB-linked outer membrane protein [Mucilaginibacter sp. AW1-3]
MLCSTAVYPQTTIHGTVTESRDGSTLPGVSVLLKGSTKGVQTDANGLYTINAPLGSTLVFSFIGYRSQEIQVNSALTNVSLVIETNALNEVVVIGYGTQRRASLTASTSSVTANEIKDQITTNILDAVASQVPGVEVTASTGRPGASPTVKIRGTGSISADNTPLYVVDGIPLADASDINMINPNDVASFDVLKDASAAAIYGSRGGNGVVLITTKKGKAGQGRIDFNYYTGIQDIPKMLKLLNRDESIQYYKEQTAANWASVNGNPATPNGSRLYNNSLANVNYIPAFDDPANVANTDWQSLIYQKNAPTSNYQLSGSGGSDKVTFFVSGNYLTRDGIVKATDFKRYTGRVNLDAKVNSFFKVGMNFSPSYSIENRRNTDLHINSPDLDAGVILSALVQPPTIAPKTPEGLYNSNNGVPLYTQYGYATANSPLQPIEDPKYHWTQEVSRYMGSTYGEIEFIKGLTFRSTLGIDARSNWSDKYRPSTVSVAANGTQALTPTFPGPNIANIAASRTEGHTMNWTWDNILTYQHTFAKDHDLNLLGGYSAQKYTAISNTLAGAAGSFQNDLVPNLAGSASIVGSGVSKNIWTLLSYLARASYAYKNKYLLQAVIRRDGSSKFGTDTKWGNFPSVSAGWRISEEDFAKRFTLLNELKLRGSYGEAGNFNIGYYPGIPSLSSANYTFGNSGVVSGYAPGNLPNNEITWEYNKKMDVGLDVSILKNRVNLTFDYYSDLTTGLLYSLPVPALSGFTSQNGNVGEIQNRGIDISLRTTNIDNAGFKWVTDLNFSRNRNKVLHLGKKDETITTNSEGSASTQQLRVDYPVSVFYGYKIDGVFKDQADVDAHSEQRFTENNRLSGPGDTKFVDVNGDGKITADDRTVIGDPNPDFTYGITNRFSYKGIDLAIELQGVQGNDVFMLSSRFIGSYGPALSWNQLEEEVLNRWQSPSQPGNGLYPRQGTTGNAAVGYTASQPARWLRDGSYLRVRNVTLGYNVPSLLTRKAHISSVRLYATAQNLFTFTHYVGYNPDVNVYSGGGTNNELRLMGIDYASYPLTRTFTFGINVGL